MAEVNNDAVAPRFGVLTIFGETFSVFFRGFLLFAGTALLAQIVVFAAISVLSVSSSVRLGTFGVGGISTTNPGFSVVVVAVMIVTHAMSGAIISLGAFDIKMGNAIRFTKYIGIAFRNILYIVGCSLIVWLVFVVALGGAVFLTGLTIAAIPPLSFVLFPALFVMGLYVFGMFSITYPSVVIEKSGLGAIGRSISLTRGYRWPIIGLYAVSFIFVMVVFMVLGALLAFTAGVGVLATSGIAGLVSVVLIILNALMMAVLTGFAGVMLALVFARLKEIKEGFGFENIGSIFD